MKIVIALNNYTRFTGSEMYVYELSRVLAKRGHKVTILANEVRGEIASRTKKNGVKMYEFFGHPELKPDIIHVQQPNPTAYCLRFFPQVPHIVTVHSEFIYEIPMIDTQIKKYIFVRPEIQEKYLTDEITKIPQDKGVTILNGVDTNRFNTLPTGDINPNSVLFVGTFDQLRTQALSEIIKRTGLEKKELVLITEGYERLVGKLPKHVRLLPPTWDVEKWTKYCGSTAGILMGRTTIEGWMCGKSGIIYEINEEGGIVGIRLVEVPDQKKLKVFDIEYMTDRVVEVYEEALR